MRKKVNNIQKVIVEHKESPFNKGAITCKLTTYGHISLTNKNYTETFKGTKNKRPIESKDYARILLESFGITQEKYVGKNTRKRLVDYKVLHNKADPIFRICFILYFVIN